MACGQAVRSRYGTFSVCDSIDLEPHSSSSIAARGRLSYVAWSAKLQGYTGTRSICGERPELTEVSGTGLEVVPNLPKCRVRVLR